MPERELVIQDLGVLNDKTRTGWSGALATGSGVADGAWSFGRLMAGMSGPVAPEDFVRDGLAQWEASPSVHGQDVATRSRITQVINTTPFKVLGACRSLGHAGLHESPRPRFSESHEQAFRVLVS